MLAKGLHVEGVKKGVQLIFSSSWVNSRHRNWVTANIRTVSFVGPRTLQVGARRLER